MSSCDAAVVAPTLFDALRLGRSAQVIVAPLLRFWDSRNIKEQGELPCVSLMSRYFNFLFYSQNSVIHEFIPAARFTHYRPSLRSGSIVKDIVGMIRSVQGSDLKDAGVMTRVVVRFVIEPSMEIYLSLWDEPAVKFRGLLKSGDRTNSVILVLFILQAPCLSNHLQLPIFFGTPISHPLQSSQLDARGKSSPVSRLQTPMQLHCLRKTLVKHLFLPTPKLKVKRMTQ
ncbi:unnamed protein product [Brassica napus]|uniref:(rape) hypothetical protein n=1 Tax=Brassica napus TaxID=3708 RepID=A0A816RV43_BRANA|nr:unnamed protein product [Brassica napus]